MRCTTKTCQLTGHQHEQYIITDTDIMPMMSMNTPPATIFTSPSVDGSGVPMPPPPTPKPSRRQQQTTMNSQVDGRGHFSQSFQHDCHDVEDLVTSGNDDDEYEKISSSSRDAARIMERYSDNIHDKNKSYHRFNFNNLDHHPTYDRTDSRQDDYEQKFSEYNNQRENYSNDDDDDDDEELQYEYHGPATYHNDEYQNMPHQHFSSSFSISTKSEINVMDKVHNQLQKVSFNEEYDDEDADDELQAYHREKFHLPNETSRKHMSPQQDPSNDHRNKNKSLMNVHSIMRPPLSPSMSKDNGSNKTTSIGQNNVSHTSTMTTKSSTNSRSGSRESNISPNSSATTAIAGSNVKEKNAEEEKKLVLKRRSKAKKNMQRRQAQSPSANKSPSNGNESDKNLSKSKNENSKKQVDINMVKSKRRIGGILGRKIMDDAEQDDLELYITHHFLQMEERLEQRLEEMESRIDFKLSKLNRLLQLVSNAQEQPEQSYKYRLDKHSDAAGGKKLVVVLDNN